jgi:hypothetical protein
MESHWIATEAQFIVDSLPNTKTAAAEQVVHQLDAIRIILLSFDDPSLLWKKQKGVQGIH